MAENVAVTKKIEPSIPANYVSILQLQERWLKEKERKQKEKEEEERRRNQHVEEQKRGEKYLEKEVGDGVRCRNSDGKGFGRKDRRFSGRNLRRKERFSGGEAISGDSEEPIIAAVVIENGEAAAAAAAADERSPEIKKKKKRSGKKKRNQAPIEGNFVGCETNAPPENSRKDDIPVKKVIGRVYKPKEVDYPPSEKAPTDPKTAMETRFEVLTINGGEERGDATKLNPRARLNRGHDNERRNPRTKRYGREPMMVWVKKGEIPAKGNGSGQ
ncbi:PREDICTED: uncharacterized protein LOC104825784 [Tarenaya hassleriana]|uniref:uncharacterized protein LOC104825784 n=1 Tax=Tarenaya hassleriana TaxID=28532 RepID=UPI0008FD241F|nr:PREDICTED: uncharacterized protein LOC104825784 [Tarenaya hassleriana]XP_019059558.1 PREDICTED: uncharacterized protein LOC104825784 [Tarenaya hassleriana]